MKVDLQLSPELEQFVEQRISAGQFTSASELIATVLQFLKGSETLFPADPTHVANLRRQVAIGIEQADKGQFADFDAETIKAEGRRRLASKRPS